MLPGGDVVRVAYLRHMGSERVTLTIRLEPSTLDWAIRFLNDYIAEKDANTMPEAHDLASALSQARPSSADAGGRR